MADTRTRKSEVWKRCVIRLKTAQRHMLNVRLHAELFLLDRLVYKFTSQLRREKSFQLLRRLRNVVSKIDQLNPREFPQRLIEEGRKLRRQSGFPSQAALQDLETLTQLLETAEALCEKVAAECKLQLEKALFMTFHLVVLANTSRVWSTVKFAAFTTEHVGKALRAYSATAKPTKSAAALLDVPPVAAKADSDEEAEDAAPASGDECTAAPGEGAQEEVTNTREADAQGGAEGEGEAEGASDGGIRIRRPADQKQAGKSASRGSSSPAPMPRKKPKVVLLEAPHEDQVPQRKSSKSKTAGATDSSERDEIDDIFDLF